MYNKLCPWCDRRSYSATQEGIWNCPYCGEDITSTPGATGYNKYPPGHEPKQDEKK
ncbi:MAG: hypothetical protein DDT34_00633 [Firmicutes bacterium]|nr:hypothetical protein [Bacillota bacterium]MBT9156047.1 hypothetical protein [candidate division NPL-UPA2 bacterium]MBT9157582.1 hypothetical protein [Bacillota bacterium]